MVVSVGSRERAECSARSVTNRLTDSVANRLADNVANDLAKNVAKKKKWMTALLGAGARLHGPTAWH